ncbi:glycerol-3-phosphate cytidylyltransferase [Campylobacter jejuni]|uniref:adenylyltransferase/cytidyltransferase family protein n=1 Tax=Campylobacter jejuni TaxID=197 RepID=UPI0012C8FE05|nr:adenylyltransferase/cytidyltransferase family protein [Campylobacter jejuni]EAH4946268.1 glycerol-3-phosphate cytidylyltransferase [Campylobacter jejuni]EAK7188291.1 glycerol-3-phosphate cytidylyltransferase [Campylobacter jejuni]EAL8537668.1 glycerol-3-phosphate cytidylyltransferase [Campylobacter jejuni]EGM0400006.1 adenylyltransferase/cytidyltransferase family protein [Campylobacter jejuni]EHU4778028.1 adenylyltransferase/cytidyltransferase family protein [Campylobacter jejuni]
MKNVITFGTFDLFHYGHLRILERAASLGDKLIVGVSSDSLNFAKKHRYPIYSEQERLNIISSLKCVSCVFLEEALELKRDYLLKYQANILVMGDDWKGKFDCFDDICDVIYFERTPSISTTEIIERIKL